MNRQILTALLFAPLSAFAQTYYYVDNISVAPVAPTTSDPVTITLIGNLAATNCFIVPPTSVFVSGFNVNITVNAGTSGIGSPTLTPHNEFFSLGTLPAGTYTINITGTFTGDFASAPEHTFIVSGGGGSPCDSVIIDQVQWAPFSDTALVVHVYNYSSELFDYPGWILFNDLGDTLAKETVNFFGIASESWHTLTIHPGATIPTGTFTGTLELWTGFYTDLACTFDWTGDLCPASCTTLVPYMQNTGGIPVTGNVDWDLYDAWGVNMGSGQFEFGPDQYSQDSLCVVPGHYSLVVNHPSGPGGLLTFGLQGAFFNIGGPSATFTQDGVPDTLAFDFVPACFDGENGIAEPHTQQMLHFSVQNGLLNAFMSDGSPLGTLLIIDTRGRTVIERKVRGSSAIVNVAALAPGVYMVHAREREGVARVLVE